MEFFQSHHHLHWRFWKHGPRGWRPFLVSVPGSVILLPVRLRAHTQYIRDLPGVRRSSLETLSGIGGRFPPLLGRLRLRGGDPAHSSSLQEYPDFRSGDRLCRPGHRLLRRPGPGTSNSRFPDYGHREIELNPRFPISRKWRLPTSGSNRHDYDHFTTPDVYPTSDRWLALMANGFRRRESCYSGSAAWSAEKGFGELPDPHLADDAPLGGLDLKRVCGRPYRGMRQNYGFTKRILVSAPTASATST